MSIARNVWALLACVACFVSSAHAAEPEPKNAAYTIVAFGDSTTAPREVHDGNLNVYADRIARSFVHARVINAGVPSDTTARARKRFESDVLAHRPDLVIIQFGLNDSCIDVRLGKDTPRVALEDYIDNLRYFVETLTARGSRVILMTPNPMLWTEKLKDLYGRAPYDPDDRWGFNLLNEQYAAAVRALAQRLGVPLVDVYQKYADYDRVPDQSLGDLLLDGMHPNARGHEIIAGLLMREIAADTMKKAATFFRNDVASHGGYVYFYSVDLEQRWGEGVATPSQIWVQPPGTPTVGVAFVKAYAATGDRFYLDAAVEAANALVYGQLASGGWTNSIDFDPNGHTAQYRNGNGAGKNNSSLDDGQTQSAIRLLVQVDEALAFKDDRIHESAQFALDALLAAQFPNGGFPQVWTGPSAAKPVTPASYPEYDWRTERRIKNYWDLYTLNDNVPGYVAQTLIDASRVYEDERYRSALKRLGDFLLLAQMPDPQPAWAQQYTYAMNPAWARPFEPPTIAGDESQEAIETLMQIYSVTGDKKYLEPIPRTLTYLKRSLLQDGRLARYYELETNKPLYMTRQGDTYTLTYDDADLPKHYAWKIESRLEELEQQYGQLTQDGPPAKPEASQATEAEIREIITSIDHNGRWISVHDGEPLVGQPDFERGFRYISSEVFSQNVEALSQYLNK